MELALDCLCSGAFGTCQDLEGWQCWYSLSTMNHLFIFFYAIFILALPLTACQKCVIHAFLLFVDLVQLNHLSPGWWICHGHASTRCLVFFSSLQQSHFLTAAVCGTECLSGIIGNLGDNVVHNIFSSILFWGNVQNETGLDSRCFTDLCVPCGKEYCNFSQCFVCLVSLTSDQEGILVWDRTANCLHCGHVLWSRALQNFWFWKRHLGISISAG